MDNAKYAYVAFYYEFMDRCLDTNRFHVIEGDTDSIYFAVAGDEDKGIQQGIEAIVKDRTHYEAHIFDWLPDPTTGIEDKKKLGKLSIEKESDVMIAIAPKCYHINTEKESIKIKGCSIKKNPQITGQDFIDVVNGGDAVDCTIKKAV
jgi:DNA polymerase elongation subunit (family B)